MNLGLGLGLGFGTWIWDLGPGLGLDNFVSLEQLNMRDGGKKVFSKRF